MRVLVCGSRHFNNIELMEDVLKQYNIKVIISGAARGADTLAIRYGERHGLDVLQFPALWDKHGRAAGPIRNMEMLTSGRPDLVIAFLAPGSRGTKNMIEISQKAGVETVVIDIA